MTAYEIQLRYIIRDKIQEKDFFVRKKFFWKKFVSDVVSD